MRLDSCANITDVGMAAFEDMRRLRSLDLSDTAVGDAGIAHLSKTVTLVRTGMGSSPNQNPWSLVLCMRCFCGRSMVRISPLFSTTEGVVDPSVVVID